MTGRSGRCGERSQGVRLTVHPAKSTRGRGHAGRTLFASLLAAPGPDKSFRFTRPRITLRTRPPRTIFGGSTHRECRTPALASLFLGKTGEPGIHETSGAVERCNSCTPILQSGQILHRGRAGVTPHPRKLPREVSRGRMLNGEHLWPLCLGIRRYGIRTRAIRPRPGNTSTPGPSLRQRRQ